MRETSMLSRSLVTALSCLAVTACSTMQNLHAVPALPDSTQLMRHTTSGYQYQTIFSFLGFDGATPAGSLVYFKGKLYGTTERGGYYSQGTVFSVTLSGSSACSITLDNPATASSRKRVWPC